ncbi:MAG: PAS domain S-box protein [Bacteroidales bacterium]|nr:PAS domain S-box protein [Bacteroidales bacterium]MCF8454400.1 PAS domain S-box protein [Bacteroidales bacterium]
MHRLLRRQIRKYLSEEQANSHELYPFLAAVDEAYLNYQSSFEHLERILELSAKESFGELTNFKNAINAATQVGITDHKGIIKFANENFLNLTGYTKEELIGKTHSIFNSGYHPKKFFTELWDTILAGKIWKGEICNRAKNGKIFWVDSTIVPLLNEAGKPNQFIVIRKDVTKEKRAEEEILEYARNLELINKELDQFAYVVSHDLKAPLRAINNLSEWIEEDLEGKLDGDTLTNMELLRGRVHRMENLINGILDYSRIGRKQATIQLVDLNELLRELVSPELLPSNFKLILPDNFPVFKTERVAIEQVFSNFVSNAIKYNTDMVPVLEIGFSEIGNFYEFFVADNGPGIEPEYHDQVFIIFQTLQSRDKIESTGVGLAIVKKIIQEKGGKVWIESNNGKGAKFCFTWPKYCTNN